MLHLLFLEQVSAASTGVLPTAVTHPNNTTGMQDGLGKYVGQHTLDVPMATFPLNLEKSKSSGIES